MRLLWMAGWDYVIVWMGLCDSMDGTEYVSAYVYGWDYVLVWIAGWDYVIVWMGLFNSMDGTV